MHVLLYVIDEHLTAITNDINYSEDAVEDGACLAKNSLVFKWETAD